MNEKVKNYKLFGMPWYLTLGASLIVIIAMALGGMGTDMPATLAMTLAIGVPLYELGKRVPIWNTYIGGGILMAFMGTALINHLGWIPEKYVEAIDTFTGDVNFLTVFIVVLITGSVLSLDRKTLLKSFIGYFPAILGGLVGAMGLGILAGLVFGVTPARIITHYVLPIMGGGNGGGAIPLSEIYEKITGDARNNYYGFAIIILTVANIFAILGSALLNKLGERFPKLTGDKYTLLRSDAKEDPAAAIQKEMKDEEATAEKKAPTIAEMGAGFFIAFAAYAVGSLLSAKILPTIFGFPIHRLAYMILFVVILAATGVVPERIREGAKRVQSFFTSIFTVVIMVGVGIDMDFNELIKAMTVANVIISIFIVLGAILGAGLIGQLVGFYPIDTAVTAGLCMANRGGSGDLAVLGAGDRMGLMAYAQLSSRLGGAIVLIIASVLFSILL